MAGAAGEAGNRVVPAKDEIRSAAVAERVAHRPATFSRCELGERSALRLPNRRRRCAARQRPLRSVRAPPGAPPPVFAVATERAAQAPLHAMQTRWRCLRSVSRSTIYLVRRSQRRPGQYPGRQGTG